MRTSRLSVVGIIILGLLGGVGGVMAQTNDEEAVPAELPTGPAEFTISEFDGLSIVATDPRMSGAATEGREVFSRTLPTGHFVASVPLRIRNDAGGWECLSSEYGTVGPESYWPWYSQSWCVGEGAYEGLGAIMFASMDTGPDGAIVETDPHGLIFEGDPPVWLEATEPPAE